MGSILIFKGLTKSHAQERMKDSQEQLQLLTQQMNQLMQEKAELETRNKILEQVVRLNVEHVDQLQTNKVRLAFSSSFLKRTLFGKFSKQNIAIPSEFQDVDCHADVSATLVTNTLQRKSQTRVFLLQQVLDIEQSMLLEAYTQFVSKVEQKPKESVEEAKKWMMGQLLQQGFQVSLPLTS